MNIKDIQTIINHFEKSSLQTLELETSDYKLKLSKNKAEERITSKEEPKPPVSEKPLVEDKTPVLAPLVGTFYASNDHGPLVSVGKKVSKGDVIGIIEAMKIFNEITAPVDGVITEIFASHGMVVGFHDVLMMIGPEHEK
ncbi:MAG: acetyl-CoA carboxylase biotin carboxyl carrier protein subunit [Bacilli bacterium]